MWKPPTVQFFVGILASLWAVLSLKMYCWAARRRPIDCIFNDSTEREVRGGKFYIRKYKNTAQGGERTDPCAVFCWDTGFVVSSLIIKNSSIYFFELYKFLKNTANSAWRSYVKALHFNSAKKSHEKYVSDINLLYCPVSKRPYMDREGGNSNGT